MDRPIHLSCLSRSLAVVVIACASQSCAPPSVVVAETELTSAARVGGAAAPPEVPMETLEARAEASRRSRRELGRRPIAAPKNADGFAPSRPSSDRRASTFGLWK